MAWQITQSEQWGLACQVEQIKILKKNHRIILPDLTEWPKEETLVWVQSQSLL